MKKKIKNLFSLILLFLFIILKNNLVLANQIENYIEPEEQSDFDYGKSKRRSSETQIIVTANDYASEIGGSTGKSPSPLTRLQTKVVVPRVNHLTNSPAAQDESGTFICIYKLCIYILASIL